jgi:hypothetical protein
MKSVFPISPEKDYKQHIQERVRSLFLFNEVRAMELLETIQFGLGYLIVGFLAGTTLDYAFPHFKEDISTKELFFEVLLQGILLAIAVFYVRKIVKIMPFLFILGTDINGDGRVDKYHPYLATEYSGEVMIALVMIGAQFNLIKKLDLLSRRLYRWLYNEEKTVQHSLGL